MHLVLLQNKMEDVCLQEILLIEFHMEATIKGIDIYEAI